MDGSFCFLRVKPGIRHRLGGNDCFGEGKGVSISVEITEEDEEDDREDATRLDAELLKLDSAYGE